MNTQASRRHHIWILLAAGLAVRLAVMFITGSVFYDPLLGWIILLCNLAIGYVLYWLGSKAAGDTSPPSNRPLVLAAFWVFNPAAIFASTAGGLYEPIIVLAMVLFLDQIRRKVYSIAVILFLPAALQLRFWLQAPGYASDNALNFFALIGGFRQPLYAQFWGFSYSMLGVVLVLAVVLGAAAALYADHLKGSGNYYLIIGGYFALLYVFAPNMQLGSLYPALVMLLLHFCCGRTTGHKNHEEAAVSVGSGPTGSDPRILGLYAAFSAMFFANLSVAGDLPPYNVMTDGMLLASVANVVLALVLVYVLVNEVWPELKWLAPPGETGRQGIPVKYYIGILLVIGFLIRVMAVANIDFRNFFEVDHFRLWAVQLHEYGLPRFYSSLYWESTTAQYGYDVPYYITRISRTDYPPVYLYVLYIIGALASMSDMNLYGMGFYLLLFMPAILCDMGIGYVLYRRAVSSQREGSREKLPVILAAFWILNPAVILVSSIWGQVASVYVLMLLLSLLLLRGNKLLPACVLFGLAVITNPLSLVLLPVYFVFVMHNKYSVWQLVVSISATVSVMALAMLPFNFFTAARHTWAGVNSQIYGSVHAFNFFALIGGNMRGLGTRFMGITYGFMGVVIIFVIMVAMIAATNKVAVSPIKKDRECGRYFLIAGALFALMFVFSFRMTALYLFPALPFLLLYAIESRDRRVLGLYVGFSAMFFFNCVEVLRWIRHMGMRSDVLRIVSLGNIVLGCVLLYVVAKTCSAAVQHTSENSEA
ncbi:MAG: glycosyltransferase 87 family protein [Defluviitaleaceae bacterium]|nr:glycosyltransferase 87 family protein [Defluviitaleaceae bacterium]